MKSLHFAPFLLLLTLASPAVAQSTHQHSTEAAAPSGARKAFDKLKTLAGSWAGRLTTFPEAPPVSGNFAQFSMKVTSRGNALLHEFSVSGIPDHPVTMFYVDEERLNLTHYCDAGNRPHMLGKLSADGKTLEFDFVDLSGGNERGHMHHVVFTFVDENHHTEDWTYMLPGDKPVRAHFELQRIAAEGGAAGN